jgi:type I restriction enzyme S subunit
VVAAADWEVVRLGDFADVRTGPFGSALHASDYVPTGTPIITVEHLGRFRLEGDDAPMVADKDRDRLSRYILRDGDIVFSRVGSIGRFGLVTEHEEGWLFSGRLLRVRLEHGYAPFVYRQMCTTGFIRQIESVAVGQTMPSLNTVIVNDLRILLPSLREQRAIAEALSDADALVESLDALIAKKQDMKQAVMQRFMTPGSTLPGATMVRLGDVVQVRKGELITESTAIPGDVPVIAGGKDAAYHCARWNRDGLTVTISASGANAGYVKLRKGRLWASDCSTISESPEYDVRYVAAQLEVRQSKLYRSQFGGAQPHVRPNDIAAIEVCWVDIAQQQMIGEMVADVDAEIDALVAQREKAELVKQGMMQELLSGRVRLA